MALILCAGIMRSGSTLQYNIVKRILELTNKGTHIHAHQNLEIARKKALQDKSSKLYVHKTHIFPDDLKSHKDKIKLLMIYRDMRDVIVSMMAFRNHSFEKVIKVAYNQTIKNEKTFLNNFEDYYRVKYEDVYQKIKSETLNISNFLGIKLNEEKAQQIEYELNIKSLKSKTNKITGMNPDTLLGPKHINNAGCQQWRNMLSYNQIKKTENIFGEWLIKNGYELYE